MPLAGILVQYSGWSSVFYVYGETPLTTMTGAAFRVSFTAFLFCFVTLTFLLLHSPVPFPSTARIFWNHLVLLLVSSFLWKSSSPPHHHRGGKKIYWGKHRRISSTFNIGKYNVMDVKSLCYLLHAHLGKSSSKGKPFKKIGRWFDKNSVTLKTAQSNSITVSGTSL